MSTACRILCAWLLVLALPVWAQAPARIAWVWPGSASGELPRSSAFKEGMRENGMVEGQHYVLDERYADGNYERFPAMTEELLALKPAILMVITIASVRVAQQATRTVPIVFVATMEVPDSMLFSERERIIAFALRNRILYFGSSRDWAAAGTLISYGFAQRDQFRRAAIIVKKILAGAKPGDLPVEQPTKFELVINLKTAKAIGITMPQSLLLRAD